MASFPDNLPPEGLEILYKLLIYFGLLYIVTTSITTWLVTRRRSSSRTVDVPVDPVPTEQPRLSADNLNQPILSLSQTLKFEDTQDRLSSMKIEIQGAEAALQKLKELQNNQQISSDAFTTLSSRYNDIVTNIRTDMNQMLQSDIETSSGEIDEGITDDEMEALEADLEQQLLDLDNDDSFLKKRPKKDLNELLDDSDSQIKDRIPVTKPAAANIKPAAEPPIKPKEQKRVPMPPPPQKVESSTTPPQTTPVAPPTKPSAPEKSSMMPPPPKKVQAPPPPGTQKATPPKAIPPAAPTSNQPLSAAQPMKVETEENDGMFAKSTSIAALRMDMLRELARLKKLIPEDQDKDQ